jgi:hypothetical protein
LKARAATVRVDVATYAARQLTVLSAPRRSLRKISGPIGAAFSRSGVSEDQLSDLLSAEKHALRAEHREKPAG